MTPTRLALLFLLSVFGMTATVPAADPKPGSDWPSFRGIRASGVAEGFPTLTTWDIPKKQGLRWRTALDGLGTSSPIDFAALRLIASSYLVGACTGKSAGFSPLRIRST